MSESTNLDHLLDRLVDGELSSAEYRQLLAMLDEQPGAWRRCALAFLEAQALGGELKVLRGECLEPPAQPATPVPRPLASAGATGARELWRQSWFLGLAMAASFLLALPLGPLLWNLSGGNRSTSIAENPPTVPEKPETTAQLVRVSTEPLGNLRLVMGGDDRAVDVPIYHADRAGELLAGDQAEGLSPEMMQLLSQAGHRVEREQSMLPVDTEDGGRVLVPIDRYQITPVSNRVQ